MLAAIDQLTAPSRRNQAMGWSTRAVESLVLIEWNGLVLRGMLHGRTIRLGSALAPTTGSCVELRLPGAVRLRAGGIPARVLRVERPVDGVRLLLGPA